MKHARKIVTLAIVLAMIMAFMVPTALAAQEVTAGTGPASIKITNASAGETYTVVKLFDASVGTGTITYSGDIPAELTTYFTKNVAGNIEATAAAKNGENLSAEAIAAMKTWALAQVATASATVNNGETELVFKGLEYGYYVVTTTQGTVVTVTSTNPNAEIQDKNTAPTVEKKITNANSVEADGSKAIAQVGTNVTYTTTITVGTGALNYVYHDTMETGLTFNNDITVTDKNGTVSNTNYTVNGGVAPETFTITFIDGYIATLTSGDKISISYTAKVVSDQLSSDPANNTAYVSYGSAGKSTSTSTAVYNAKFSVTKNDGTGNALVGAGFVIKNADNKYYKLDGGVVNWVDAIGDATEYTSAADGKVPAFTGLANGTYTLVEKTVPAGYNRAVDSSFTIAAGDYTISNLERTATVVNNAGSLLPSTGGIGTTIFYVLGGFLAVGALVILVTNKRMGAKG